MLITRVDGGTVATDFNTLVRGIFINAGQLDDMQPQLNEYIHQWEVKSFDALLRTIGS